MRRILGITGTPGTGKKTVAPLVAIRLDLPCFSMNDFVDSKEGVGTGSIEVDASRLRRRILARSPGRMVVFGHLLPDTFETGDVEAVAVLRCDPAVLKRRLRSRGYSLRKVAENVEAELIGVVSAEARMRFGGRRVADVDVTSLHEDAAARRVARALGSPGTSRVDWLTSYASAVKLRSLLSERMTESAFT